jgi:hypothetical protein
MLRFDFDGATRRNLSRGREQFHESGRRRHRRALSLRVLPSRSTASFAHRLLQAIRIQAQAPANRIQFRAFARSPQQPAIALLGAASASDAGSGTLQSAFSALPCRRSCFRRLLASLLPASYLLLTLASSMPSVTHACRELTHEQPLLRQSHRECVRDSSDIERPPGNRSRIAAQAISGAARVCRGDRRPRSVILPNRLTFADRRRKCSSKSDCNSRRS